MACDLATVLLALKLANGQIYSEPTTWNLSTMTSNSVTGTGMVSGDASAQLAFHEARIKQLREEIAAEKKRKADRAFINQTLKECGKK